MAQTEDESEKDAQTIAKARDFAFVPETVIPERATIKLPQDMVGPLVDAIEETISALFSRDILNSLYYHLETYHSTPKNQVPYHLGRLLFVLDNTFGAAAARTIGRAIARRFYEKLQLPFTEIPNYTFLEYVEKAITTREASPKGKTSE